MRQGNYTLRPNAIEWEPMPQKLPRVRKCPTCKSAPLWRHNLQCYWLVCTKCGLETAAARSPSDVAYVWNQGGGHHDLVDGLREITMQNMDEIIEEATRWGNGSK